MTQQHSPAALVVNTASRTGAAAYERARERLAQLDVPIACAYPVRDPGELLEVIEQLNRDRFELVIVGGGDGTISTAVDHLAIRHITVGILPLGTANDLARTLHIPADVDAACEVIANGKLVDIDVGRMGDQHFLNVASIGLSSQVTDALSPRLKRRLGPVAYPVAALRAYYDFKPFPSRLEFPDGDHEPISVADTVQIAVGNGRHYGGGQTVSPMAGIDDHSLDVYVIGHGRWRDRIAVLRGMRDGSFVERDTVWHVRTRRVHLHAEPAQVVNLDGELSARTPQLFDVHRNALDVFVPQQSTAATYDNGG